MSRFLIFICFCFLVVACSENKIPKNVLAPEKMEAVLWDALLADQAAEFYIEQDSAIKAMDKYTELYQKLFQIHKISKEDFKRSLQFYQNNPHLLKPIFDSLQKRSERSIRYEKPLPVS